MRTRFSHPTSDSLFRSCAPWDDVGIVPYIEYRTALFPSEHFLHRKMFVTPRRGGCPHPPGTPHRKFNKSNANPHHLPISHQNLPNPTSPPIGAGTKILKSISERLTDAQRPGRVLRGGRLEIGGQRPLAFRAWCYAFRYFPNPLGVGTCSNIRTRNVPTLP